MIEDIFKLFGDDEDMMGDIYSTLYGEIENKGYFYDPDAKLSDIESYLLKSELLGKNKNITYGQAESIMLLLFVGKLLNNVNVEDVDIFTPVVNRMIIKALKDTSENYMGTLLDVNL